MKSFSQVLTAARNCFNNMSTREIVAPRLPMPATMFRIVSLLFAIAILSPMGIPQALAQSAAAKKKPEKTLKPGTKTAKGGKADAEAAKPLEEIDFGAVKPELLAEDATSELDETSDGKKKLEVLETRVKEIFAERTEVDEERQPIAIRRTLLLDEVAQLDQTNAEGQQGIQEAQNEIRRIQEVINNGSNTQANRNQIENLESQIRITNRQIISNQKDIAFRAELIKACNLKLAPLDTRLLKLWLDLNICRKQWLEIRQPQQKYAHGNYEGLKQSIDDWVLIDGLWPEAYCWAALCSYELGDYEAAWNHVERAAALRETLLYPKAWAQAEALRGMIAAKLSDRKSKAENHLQLANTYVLKEKNTNWVVFFLMGRANCENEKSVGKAKMNFEKALKIKPDATCVQYWYARMKSTTTTPAIRDVAAATNTLEDLWKHSTKKSWRLAYSLVLAYDSASRAGDADATWDFVQKLAPKSDRDNMQQERDAAQAKRKSPASAEPATKAKKPEPKKSKPAEKSDDSV
ncbi:MAG: hypothetical protein JWM11_4357 [Planctomycetaceae bacterium]|nr:hypothetical protein [Planctomycetaceae bacterium]